MKKRDKNIILFFLVFFFTILLVLFLKNGFFKTTGNAVFSHNAQGGNITYLDLNTYFHWKGFYGRLTGGNTSLVTLTLDQNSEVVEQNLPLKFCNGSEIYATTNLNQLASLTDKTMPGAGYLNTLSSATASAFDTYFNFTNITLTEAKGTSVFLSNETRTFEVGDSNLRVYGRTLSSIVGSYNIGLVKDRNDEIILVFNIEDGISFNNVRTDYELMLPIPPGVANITYYLFQDSTDCTNSTVSSNSTNTTIINNYITNGGGGGGSSTWSIQRCGDSSCNNYNEDCFNCPIDCNCKLNLTEGKEVPATENNTAILLNFAKDLINENPKCKALYDLLKRAEKSYNEQDFIDSYLIIKSIIKECNNLLKQKPEEVKLRESDDLIHIIILSLILIVLIILIPLLIGRKRRIKIEIIEPTKKKNNTIKLNERIKIIAVVKKGEQKVKQFGWIITKNNKTIAVRITDRPKLNLTLNHTHFKEKAEVIKVEVQALKEKLEKSATEKEIYQKSLAEDAIHFFIEQDEFFD